MGCCSCNSTPFLFSQEALNILSKKTSYCTSKGVRLSPLLRLFLFISITVNSKPIKPIYESIFSQKNLIYKIT